MQIYFMLLDTAFLHQQMAPALAASWRQRSFEPCRSLCTALVPAVNAYGERYCVGGESLVARVARGLPFDRRFWHSLVGEILLYGAAAIPEIETAPEALGCLLAREASPEAGPRAGFAPVQQALFGARDLVFGGGYYRPESAGYNDTADVARLAAYLEGIDPESWTVADLRGLQGPATEEDRAEELEFVREWFPPLRDLYRQARDQGQVVVCEIL